jgi:tryptophan synthase alpha chain
MSRIEETFQRLSQKGRAALMPYLTLGYPQRESALAIIPALVEGGADLIELGVPFSDPLADGTIIQAASQQALHNGMNLALCLDQAKSLRIHGVETPFVLMSYYNPIFQVGAEVFARRAVASGVDGVIVPDLPPEEAEELESALKARGLDLIFLLPPTASPARMRSIAGRSSGFLYLVSLIGVTGAREQLSTDLSSFIADVREETDLPLAVGFGISTPHQAAQVARQADGVIVGSALVKRVGNSQQPAVAARNFAAALRQGIDKNSAAR